jgi:NAD(P)-dependent dehydrogenase (short-subunit alcohol dehydrogenase family)
MTESIVITGAPKGIGRGAARSFYGRDKMSVQGAQALE